MNPEQSTDLALTFTGPLSPWWLLLVLPAVLAAAWLMYQRELKAIEKPHRLPLLLIRLALLAIVALLLFQPQVTRRLTLIFNGRTVFVLDDSRSMAARDSRLGDAAALRLARALAPAGEDVDGQADPLVNLTGGLESARAEVRAFQRYAADADRESDAYWERFGRTQASLEATFNEADQQLETVASLAPGLNDEFGALRKALAEARGGWEGLFGSQTAPPTERYDEVVDQIDAAIDAALLAQGAFDRLRIAEDDEARAERARQVRAQRRVDLAMKRLVPLADAEGYELTRLSDLGSLDWPRAADAPPIEADANRTDLVGAIDRIVETPNDFPLQSIVLISDGRDTLDRPTAPLVAKLARLGVPVIGAGAGATREPIDLAVTDLVAAPIGVAGQPMTIRVGLKSAPDQSISRKLSLTNPEGQVLAEQVVDFVPGEDMAVGLKLTAEEPGLMRLTVEVERAPNEAFPRENNASDLVVNILERPMRVLMLDHRPRWQTRFILNILKRLPYVDLNAIVLTTQPKGELRRGVERGAWPEDEAALGTYDMVILGDLPEGTLTADELEAVQRLVAEKGRTLLTIAPTRERPLERLAHLALSPAGRDHPITRPLAGPIADRDVDADALMVDARDDRPLIETAFVGEGRSVALRSDRLWKPLNPSYLAEHTRLFVELMTWAVESQRIGQASSPKDEASEDEPRGPRLRLDQRRSQTDQAVAVGVENAGDAGTVIAMMGEDAVAEAPIEAGRARFEGLPAGSVRFQLAGEPELNTPVVEVIERSTELDRLARDADWLASLSDATGGKAGELADLDRLLADVEPRRRVERNETTYRLWDATELMVLLVVGLTVEWVWRKLSGLV